MTLTKDSTYTLSNGNKIPVIGFGTYQTPPESAQSVVYHALKQGFRHIDSAQRYGNERQVVQGIVQFLEETHTPRDKIFYTTKVDTPNHGYEITKKSLELSLEDAKELGYIDLVLIHDPLSDKRGRLSTWLALQEYYKAGKIKSIGVSNYGIQHLKELLDNNDILEVKPQVNQLSVNPWLYREDLINFCTENGLLVEAYSALTRAKKLNDETLVSIAKKYNATPPQILTQWSLKKGLLPLVKTLDPIKRGQELIDSLSLTLSNEDVERLTHKDDYFLPQPEFDPPADKSSLGALNG